MRYQGKEIDIISQKQIFGKAVAEIRILATGELRSVPVADLEESVSNPSIGEVSFKAIAAKIKAEVQNQSMLAPYESNIIPLPHQILALEKVMNGSFLRYLIADEVGMGKTIETGLVLKELKLRSIVKKALIIVPKSALLQWQQEMKRHFNEMFHIYDTDYINIVSRTFARIEADNEINLFAQHNQIIVSMDALRPIETRQGWSRQRVEEYNKYRLQSVLEADFDMLVIDECHKVGGSNNLVGRFQMAEILCSAIPNVLLLSATPHRGKSDHFRRILQLLDSDAFTGEGMPAISELEPFVVRTEKRQAIDYNGKPLFNKRTTQRIEVQYDAVRHRKQQNLYAAVTDYVVNGFNLAQQTKNNSYGFVMLLFQRMMSSSTQAILDAMQKRADRLSSSQKEVNKESVIQSLEDLGYESQLEIDFEQKVFSLLEETHANYDTELSILQGLIRDAKDCLNSENDVKVEYLIEKLRESKQEEDDPDLKFLIFTEFTSTQLMLKKVLEEKGGYRCEIINGSMEFDVRVEALKKFKEQAQILVSTDAAGESLNMQFAHVVINYDLPWNPMVIEQRIGRVDRIGQRHQVLALNVMLDNSVDKRVYEVIEIKLNQIMNELGIDKTSDVLDSTMEREQINRLYLTSLLDPKRFEQESKDWLNDIKAKLKEYHSTEGALPTLNSREIKAEKVDSIKHSPLPVWLESLAKNYLQVKAIPYQSLIGGMKFSFPGLKENIYTFNLKESVNNPIPEPLSLQHEIIQAMLAEATPVTISHSIPVVKITQGRSSPGYWGIWHLHVRNGFESSHAFQPIFISDEGDAYPAFAQDIWNKLVQEEDHFVSISSLSPGDSKAAFQHMNSKAEEILHPRYNDMELKLSENAFRIRHNKQKAFEFQEKQLNKIGIGNIRQARLAKLIREREQWLSAFTSSSQVVPDLSCLVLVKVINE